MVTRVSARTGITISEDDPILTLTVMHEEYMHTYMEMMREIALGVSEGMDAQSININNYIRENLRQIADETRVQTTAIQTSHNNFTTQQTQRLQDIEIAMRDAITQLRRKDTALTLLAISGLCLTVIGLTATIIVNAGSWFGL